MASASTHNITGADEVSEIQVGHIDFGGPKAPSRPNLPDEGPKVVQPMLIAEVVQPTQAPPSKPNGASSTASPTSLKVASGNSGLQAPDRAGLTVSIKSPRGSPRGEMGKAVGMTFEDQGGRNTNLFAFADTESIKDKVRQAKLKPDPYNVHDRYHKTGFFSWLAKHHIFENLTLGVIVVNAMWISIDTDGNTADTILDAGAVYIAADVMFFAYFSFELFVRFMAFERKKYCLKDGWFCFDSTLVTLYAFDPFTIGLLAALQGGGGLNLPTAVLRLFRLARLSRLIRMLRSLPELMIMIKGMMTAAASVGYTLGLLLLITYVFAIALRNLVPKDEDNTTEFDPIGEAFFSSVPEAMHSLIVFGTFLDALSDFIIPVLRQSPACFILTWMYIALAAMTVMNMLIGVLCEVISAVAEEEKESMMVDKVNEKFSAIVEQLDKNNDGTLSWDEFQQILDYPEALAALESMNVDAECMVDMAEDFFFDDGEPVQVTFGEFMEMVLDLRGGQQGTVENIMALQKRFNKKFYSLKSRMDVIEGRCENVDGLLNKMLAKCGVQPVLLPRQKTVSGNLARPKTPDSPKLRAPDSPKLSKPK